MDLRRLEIFVESPSSAASPVRPKRSFLTQPTVSEHIRALEDELGVQLLDRLGRGAAPTPAGQLLLGYARRMLALASEAQQAIEQFQGRVSGELIVGGSTIPGEYVLPALDRRLPRQASGDRGRHCRSATAARCRNGWRTGAWRSASSARVPPRGIWTAVSSWPTSWSSSWRPITPGRVGRTSRSRTSVRAADPARARLRLAGDARARAGERRARLRRLPDRRRDGLDAGDQAGDPGRVRDLAHLPAGGGGRVPRPAAGVACPCATSTCRARFTW